MAVRCKSALSMASIFSEGQQCGFPRTATGAGHHIRDIKAGHFKYMTDQLRFLYSLRVRQVALSNVDWDASRPILSS